MKHKVSVTFILLLIFLGFSSCSTGGSADGGPVQVSFAVSSVSGEATRIVTVNDDISSSLLACYYTATPLWNGSDFTAIQGKTNGFQRIDTYRSGMSLGLFAQGKWRFEVQIKRIDAEQDEADWILMYSGSTDTYINAGSTAVSVSVAKNTAVSGSVVISVRAPTADGAADSLRITYSGASSGSIAAENIGISRSGGSDRWTTFTVAETSLPAGIYTFCLTYNDGADDVGGAAVAVNIHPGMTSTISGTIESGSWQNETVTFTGINSFGIQITAAGNKLEIAKNESLVYTCTKTPGSLDIASYSWFVNGDLQTGQTGSTFTLVASNYDCSYCTVTCVAVADDDSNFMAYSSLNLILAEAE